MSEQTRIREAVIEGIEGGDYSACGGDFYARANICSIVKVVGADSGQLPSMTRSTGCEVRCPR